MNILARAKNRLVRGRSTESQRFMRKENTLEVEAIGLGPIQEPNGVVRIVDGAEHILLPAGGFVGDDAGMELRELVAAAADSDEDRGILCPKRAMENLLDAAPAILEGRFDGDRGPDPELLHYVAGLEHVVGPLVGL